VLVKETRQAADRSQALQNADYWRSLGTSCLKRSIVQLPPIRDCTASRRTQRRSSAV